MGIEPASASISAVKPLHVPVAELGSAHTSVSWTWVAVNDCDLPRGQPPGLYQPPRSHGVCPGLRRLYRATAREIRDIVEGVSAVRPSSWKILTWLCAPWPLRGN